MKTFLHLIGALLIMASCQDKKNNIGDFENIPESNSKEEISEAEELKILQKQVDIHQTSQPVPQFNNAYDVWNNTSKQNIEPYYSLKNNPWSPDYKPGY